MSPHRRSLRLALGLALYVLATTVAPASAAPQLVRHAPASATELVYGAGSCVGTDACTGAAGPIGDNSCNGDHACYQAAGAIGDDSCNGTYTCFSTANGVGANSCNGGNACYNADSIGDNSCNSGSACLAAGTIGVGSCNDYYACYYVAGTVGANSCNDYQACDHAAGDIGDNSCNGEAVCQNATGNIGDCEYNDVEPVACVLQPDARIRRVGRHNLVGNNIYNTDATDQTLTATYKGDKVRFSITIQNDSDTADAFKLGADCALSGPLVAITVDYGFVHGWPAQDISAALEAGTYTTDTVAPHGKFRLRAIVSTTTPPGTGSTVLLSCLVSAESVGNPAKVDAVGFKVNFDVVTPP